MHTYFDVFFNFPLLIISFLKEVNTISLQLLRDLREEERVEERGFGLKGWSLTNSLGYFDVTLTWFLSGYVLREFER